MAVEKLLPHSESASFSKHSHNTSVLCWKSSELDTSISSIIRTESLAVCLQHELEMEESLDIFTRFNDMNHFAMHRHCSIADNDLIFILNK